MRQLIALLVATLSGGLVAFVALVVWDSSTAFWLSLPSWAPILPMACYVGAVIWTTYRVFFGVHHRVASR